MKKNQLSIRLKGKQVGLLEQTSAGKMEFTYDLSASQPISMSMPIRQETYGETQTDVYFGGLLPESEVVKRIIGKKYGISSNNHFALLKVIGQDCAGAISCHSIDEPIEPESIPLQAKIISDSILYQHIKELPQKPLFLDVEGLRLSLAGVQDKAAVCLVDNQIAFAEQHCPTTHILKPDSQLFRGLAINEYFCLRIAKRLGLPVGDIQLRQINDNYFLLIERYDRRIQNGYIERIHQEDFCQALGILSSRKYQNEGGPGFKDCFNLLKQTAQPAVDRNLLVTALIFNYLVGNMDAHAKNFSLLHHSSSHIRLAPFYDMACTRVYENLASKMAMKIGNQYRAEDLFSRHWEQLCHDIQYRSVAFKKMLLKQADIILKFAEEERAVLMVRDKDRIIIDKIIKVIEENVKQVFHFSERE